RSTPRATSPRSSSDLHEPTGAQAPAGSTGPSSPKDPPMNALPKLLRTTLDLALVALFGLSALLLVGGFALPALGREMVIIDGGSMAPAIANGSAVIVDRTPTAYEVGDVVTIRVPSSG